VLGSGGDTALIMARGPDVHLNKSLASCVAWIRGVGV
jgi:hypothetical protein